MTAHCSEKPSTNTSADLSTSTEIDTVPGPVEVGCVYGPDVPCWSFHDAMQMAQEGYKLAHVCRLESGNMTPQEMAIQEGAAMAAAVMPAWSRCPAWALAWM